MYLVVVYVYVRLYELSRIWNHLFCNLVKSQKTIYNICICFTSKKNKKMNKRIGGWEFIICC